MRCAIVVNAASHGRWPHSCRVRLCPAGTIYIWRNILGNSVVFMLPRRDLADILRVYILRSRLQNAETMKTWHFARKLQGHRKYSRLQGGINYVASLRAILVIFFFFQSIYNVTFFFFFCFQMIYNEPCFRDELCGLSALHDPEYHRTFKY